MIDEKTISELREALEKEKKELVSELGSVAHPDSEVKGGWKVDFPTFERSENASHAQKEEEADEVEEYEMRLATQHELQGRLAKVERALERLKQGTYGVCSICKVQIPLERMRANPAAEYDMAHEPKELAA